MTQTLLKSLCPPDKHLKFIDINGNISGKCHEIFFLEDQDQGRWVLRKHGEVVNYQAHMSAAAQGFAPRLLSYNRHGAIVQHCQPAKPSLEEASDFMARLHRARLCFDTQIPHQTNTCITGVHSDLNPGNWVWLPNGTLGAIDWDYAGMASADWDLAVFAVEWKLEAEQIQTLLSAYYFASIAPEQFEKSLKAARTVIEQWQPNQT